MKADPGDERDPGQRRGDHHPCCGDHGLSRPTAQDVVGGDEVGIRPAPGSQHDGAQGHGRPEKADHDRDAERHAVERAGPWSFCNGHFGAALSVRPAAGPALVVG